MGLRPARRRVGRRSRYDRCNVDTLIVWGVRDQIIPVATGYKLAAELGNAELLTLPYHKQSLHLEHPAECARYIREFILQIKLGQVSREYFARKFGADPLQQLAAPIQTLRDWGFLAVDGDAIRLNREAMLQVDRLLHEFFLPQHKNVRYA